MAGPRADRPGPAGLSGAFVRQWGGPGLWVPRALTQRHVLGRLDPELVPGPALLAVSPWPCVSSATAFELSLSENVCPDRSAVQLRAPGDKHLAPGARGPCSSRRGAGTAAVCRASSWPGPGCPALSPSGHRDRVPLDGGPPAVSLASCWQNTGPTAVVRADPSPGSSFVRGEPRAPEGSPEAAPQTLAPLPAHTHV